jgi:HlyD family secretion protein
VFALLILAAVIGVALALRSRPVPIDVGHATRGRVIVAIEESGMTRVKDRFVVSSPVTGSLSRLVLEPGDGWAVFRVDDGVARLTPVKIGHRGETEAEVVSGLPVGAAVAVHPGDRVKDGVKVEPR